MSASTGAMCEAGAKDRRDRRADDSGGAAAGALRTRASPHRTRLARPDDVEGWRDAARAYLAAGVPPEAILWESGEGTQDLFGEASDRGASPGGEGADVVPSTSCADRVPAVSRSFLELAERVACHRAPDRFALLYRVLWRRAHGEPELLDCASDPDVHRLQTLGKRISRERHKMHAFVRFRQTPGVEPEHFGAWFEPEHHTLRLASGFFVRRFTNMRWSIVTPEESAHWDGRTLVFGPGGRRDGRPDAQAMELLWQTYFANIFNPARLRLDAMRSEMPVKYWKNLPEAPLIAELVRRAGARSEAMIEAPPSVPPRFAARATAAPAVRASGASDSASTGPEAKPRRRADAGSSPTMPDGAPSARGPSVPAIDEDSIETFADLPALHERTRRCTLCEHACRATRAVDGEGMPGAPLMLVGEQPGDMEDLRGQPFVGPAGALLRRLLDAENIDPETLYLTNAVRHFRFEPRGKRRLHRKPSIEHVNRCRRWLFEEIRLVRPRVILALGATAGRALLGRAVSVELERGRRFAIGDGRVVRLGAHPAAILRARDEATRAELEGALRADLVAAVASLGDEGGAPFATSRAKAP